MLPAREISDGVQKEQPSKLGWKVEGLARVRGASFRTFSSNISLWYLIQGQIFPRVCGDLRSEQQQLAFSLYWEHSRAPKENCLLPS